MSVYPSRAIGLITVFRSFEACFWVQITFSIKLEAHFLLFQLEPLDQVTVQYEEDDIEITDDNASSDAFVVSVDY